MNEKLIEIERNLRRLEQRSCCECIEIASIPSTTTNNLLKERIQMILKKVSVVLETMDIAACHRLGKTKLLLNFWTERMLDIS